jgi:2-iminobutanoate/2-iminopropanoate deaminase
VTSGDPGRPRRVVVDVPGFGHANPVPVASRIGPFLATGVLTGRDPATGEMPVGLDAQCTNMFAHVRAVLEAAGGSTDDLLSMTVRLVAFRDRAALNREWTVLFPDPATRPARRVVAAELDGGSLVQCDLLAVLAD